MEVMDLFGESKLKGQKLKLSNLLSKPEFKQNYLAPVRTLDEEDQSKLLQKVIDKKLTIQELKQAATEIKTIKALKKSFIKLVNIESWELAQEKFPQFASLDQLMKFSKFDFNQGIPQSFVEYCTRAKQSTCDALEDTDADSDPTLATCVCEGCYILASKYTEICGNVITRSFSRFNGAHLIIMSLSVVCIYIFTYIFIVCVCTYVCSCN